MEETIKTLEKMDAKIFRVDPEETKAIKNAIKYLKEYQMFKTLYTARLIIDIMPEHKEAFEMAIKALEQEPTTNNDLSDCISRKFMRDLGATCIAYRNEKQKLIPIIGIDFLPSVTPQEPQTFKWCTDCKEYDKEKHCCPRWSKVIRNAVEALEQEPKTGHWVHGEYCSECGCDVPAYIVDWKWQKDMDAKHCPNCGAKMVEPQESEEE